jgi:tetratricopeptide (TPR) repeat protein
VNAAFDGDPGDVRTWARLDPLTPHALGVTQWADREGIAEPTEALMSRLGTLFLTKWLHAQAEPLYRRALAVAEASFAPDHPTVANRLNNLAQLLRAANRLTEAEPLMRRALAIDEASSGRDHPNVAKDLNNLAQLLQATNRLAEAEPLMRRALAIGEASFGREHPNVAIYLNNLAQLLQATDRLADAEPLMRRALAIDEASFGPDHPGVAIRLNNLARLLQATNRLAEAEPLMRRHLLIFIDFERKTGHPHPHRNDATVNYTILLAEMGKSRAEVEAAIASLAAEGCAGGPQ